MNLRNWSLVAAACALGAQAPQTPPTDADGAPSPSAYSGTLREARVRVRELAEAAQHEQAAAFAESVLAAPAWSAAAEREQAEFWFAVGVARGAAQAYPQAADAAHAARGLSGSSELGLASAFNAGAFRLVHAERLRQDIPQIRERLKLPPLAASANPQLGGAPQGPVGQETASDPIQVARGAYLAARADLIERWRAGPDADTCANLELIVRRLRELDELERQNEEQQNESSERQNKDQKQDPQQQDKQDPNQQQDQQQNEEQKGEQDPKEQQDKPEDSKKDEKDEQKQDSKPESEQDKQEQQEQQPPKEGADPAKEQEQRVLTPEEVQRLLQQLDKIEDQAAQVQAALRRAKRVPVKKDW